MTKRALYERTGVPEYWIVDPVADAVRIFRRNAAGRYDLAAELSRNDTLTSPFVPHARDPPGRHLRGLAGYLPVERFWCA